ncbi:glucosaminidase domain-containing protein [Elizabethkingia miricola]|uniref:glucosaminidase domain-containing protein n=1 Tax=Elizabethkingia miricola TaxID=172045 RepID=UPI002ACEF39C|nr:glucosaminidase domain-containing protein [Elizabethkingia miricola]WQM38575.1 glucosaminidase domain-containing protein [Elizabethkingia miricola]
MTPKQFTDTYLPFAKQTEKKTGISAIAILAQAALESGWGGKVPGNMFFGVKASAATPENKKQLITTTEILSSPNAKFPVIISVTKRTDGKYTYKVKDWFRKYESPEESFTDHANFFLKNPRYSKALLVKSDPYKFIDAIAAAGYATAPNYASVLKDVARRISKFV